MVAESQPINVLAATSGMVDSCLPRSSPLEPRISVPIQSPMRHPSEGDTTLEEPGQTLIHCTGSSAMQVEQEDTAHGNQSSERLFPQSSSRENPLTRGPAIEGSNNESHTESGLGALTIPRAPTLFQVPEPSSAGNSTENQPRNQGIDATDTSERALIDEELIRRYPHEKIKAHAARSHRTWSDEDLKRLPGWLMNRKDLSKERLEVEFLRDFGHYRTSSAVVTTCRKRKKRDSRHKDVTSAPTPGQVAPVVPAVLDTVRVSQSPNIIIRSEAPTLHPSYITLKYPPLERHRLPQPNQPQILDNTDRFSRDMPLPLHEGEEAVGQDSPAAVACESASEQMVCSIPEDAEDPPTLSNRRHRVEITPKPPARFTAVNGANVHPTDPNTSEMTPLVQPETNEGDAPRNRQGSQRASKERFAGQGREDQKVTREEVSQSKLSSNAVSAIVTWRFEEYQIYLCHLTSNFTFLRLSILAHLPH